MKKIKLSLTVDNKLLYIEDYKNSVKVILDLVIDDTFLQAWCPLEFPAPQLLTKELYKIGSGNISLWSTSHPQWLEAN